MKMIKEFKKEHNNIFACLIISFLVLFISICLLIFNGECKYATGISQALLGLSSSLISSVFFYFFQTFLPNYKKRKHMLLYAKEKLYVLNQHLLSLKYQIREICENDNEKQYYEIINKNCIFINNEIRDFFLYLSDITPDNILEEMLAIIKDDDFDIVSEKSAGKLKGSSIKELLKYKDYEKILFLHINNLKENCKEMSDRINKN